MNLNDFFGNEQTKEQLSSIIAQEKFPHAIIIKGEPGLGKSTIANIIAKASICTATSGQKPCNTCKNCLKANAKSHPDIIFPDASGVTKSFRVDTIRDIRESAYILPNEAKRKVYIFESADKMTVQAQNAFLKLLEEPPAHDIFILTCVSADALLFTVRSRCRVYSLQSVSEAQTLEFLHMHYPEFSENEITAAANLSQGNIGRATELLKNTIQIKCKLRLKISPLRF